MRYRPSTTGKYSDDNQGYWAVFWHVSDLRELADGERREIAAMWPLEGRKPYGRPFEPEGPILIQPVD